MTFRTNLWYVMEILKYFISSISYTHVDDKMIKMICRDHSLKSVHFYYIRSDYFL